MTECIFTPFRAEEKMISAKETMTHAHAVAMATCLKHILTFKGADIVEAYLQSTKPFFPHFLFSCKILKKLLYLYWHSDLLFFLHHIHVPSITPTLAC